MSVDTERTEWRLEFIFLEIIDITRGKTFNVTVVITLVLLFCFQPENERHCTRTLLCGVSSVHPCVSCGIGSSSVVRALSMPRRSLSPFKVRQADCRAMRQTARKALPVSHPIRFNSSATVKKYLCL